MSSWGGSSSVIPKIGSSKKIISLSKTKVFKEEEEEVHDDIFQEPPEIEGKGKGRMEEPLYILERIKQEQQQQQQIDTDMEEDESFWQEAATLVDKPRDTDMNELVDTETPRLESLSVNDEPTTSPKPTLKRKRVGEDVFTKDAVKQWQGSRIKAWENRYVSPEGFYYRFVLPGEGQQNGGWSNHEHNLFMKRYDDWISNGWKIGSSWGLFSCGIPHRVGYQCMNYYRKLVSDGKLRDESYITIDGKLKQTHKEKLTGIVPNTELGPEWKDPDVQLEEKNVDQWVKEFHGRTVNTAPKPKPKPKVTIKRPNNISDLVKKMPQKQYNGDEDDFMIESEPEVAHLEARDWETEWCDRLKDYKEFLIPYLDQYNRDQYWYAKQEWRRSLITTELLLQKNMVKKTSQPPPMSTTESTSKIQQSSLSRFFTGVKKRKIDTPDEFISHVRIPNDLYSGVKRIQPSNKETIDETKMTYLELDDMNDCIPLLNNILQEPILPLSSPLECILVDPPWEFYVADGKNDGECTWNLKQFKELIEKVLIHMTSGMIFVWSHKLIQADIVRMMYTLDCKYVENLVWFKKSVNNVQLDEPSPYFSCTKEILLMFKKGEGFELRHQRSPDVIIDFELPKEEWIQNDFTVPKPSSVYDMIETLLPKAIYDPLLNRGKFLELWAKKNYPRREGWISIHQIKKVTLN